MQYTRAKPALLSWSYQTLNLVWTGTTTVTATSVAQAVTSTVYVSA